MSRRLAALALALGMTGGGAASARLAIARADAPPKHPSFETTLTLVSVPVFVTDAHGRAVSGLTEADFEVQDDGKNAKILGFQAFDAFDPATAAHTDLPPAARRQFLLLFDLSFTSAHGIVKAREAALDFVAHLQPADLAGVATYSTTQGTKLLVSFTPDRYQLRKAVEGLGVLHVDRRADPLGLVYDLRDIGSSLADTVPSERSGGAGFEDAVRAMQVMYRQAERTGYRHRVLRFVEGLGELAQAIDVVQGRKQIILFSSGFDESFLVGNQGQDSYQDSEAVVQGRLWEVPSDSRFGDADVRTAMQNQLEAFTRSDAVVMAIDVGGLTARGDVRDSSEPRTRSGEESLARIANVSGGRLLRNTNDLSEALGEVLEMSRYHYLIAFAPTGQKGPGKLHKVKVELHRKGLRVAHRAGYLERTPYATLTPLARQFEASEMIAKGVDRGEIDVHGLAVPYRTREGRDLLSVALEIEGPSLLGATPLGTLSLQVYGYAFDAAGQVKDTASVLGNLDLTKVGDRLRRGGLQSHLAFDLPPGKYDLRFLVRDSRSGRSGTYWMEVTVPSFDSAGVSLMPPLVMDDPESWVVLAASSSRSVGMASPFHVAERPFVPRALAHLANGRDGQLCLLLFDGGRSYDPGASFEITPHLTAGTGEDVALDGVRVVKSVTEGSFRWFVLAFTPRNAAPGEHTLKVRLRDPASGRISEAFRTVSFD